MYDFNVFELFTPAPTIVIWLKDIDSNCSSTNQELILGNIHLVEEWLTVGATCLGGATSTNNFKWLFDKFNCNSMFCNCVCMYVCQEQVQQAIINLNLPALILQLLIGYLISFNDSRFSYTDRHF